MTQSVAVRGDEIRCSDADRERITERLREAAGEGRITMEELDGRLTSVYAARFGSELDALVADLPRAAKPSSTGWRALLVLMWAQLTADVALLFGRRGKGWTRRRVIVALIAALLLFGVAAIVVHGFADGGGGFERRGFEGSDR